MKSVFLLLISAATLAAQFGSPFPGQYPPGTYPPGRYPPGQYPGSGGSQRPGRGTSRQSQAPAISDTVSGVIRKLDARSFELEALDTRFLEVQMLDSTTKPASLRIGDGVDVTLTQDKDGMFQATDIRPNPEVANTIEANDRIPGLAPQQAEGRTGPPPTILERHGPDYDPGDSGPPVLKRGKPARVSDSSSDDAANPPSDVSEPIATPRPAPVAAQRQSLVDQARVVAANFLEGLPNYVCQESTTRYVSETREPDWQAQDVVSTEVVFEDGKERYRNMQINGRPSKKPPEESGAWSTGEFGTILGQLFSPGTDAQFKRIQDDTIEHQASTIYDFSVDRRRSGWRIWVPGQYILPAYKGSVWIDKNSGHTLRIEMQGKKIPEAFPLVSIETAVDYDYVTLGATERFLLPVHAEILSCERGSNVCERNVIEFRNYHKFTGESTIKFGDQ
ncbi:MAG TPA: hypothetical protein VMB25_09825 [Bryobacteraceae bacterium]|nr:hypothetical protein [Bryobacteraceae bacterium]